MMTVRRLLLFVALFFVCILISTGFFWKKFLDSPLNVTKPIIFEVTPGSRIEKVASDLQRQGYTRYPMLLILLARLQGYDQHLKTGEYQLLPGMKPEQLLKKIVKGKVYLRRYTLVEGWTLKQVFTSLKNNSFLQHTIDSADLDKLAKSIGTNSANLEGFFNPDTYLFAKGVPDITILKKAYWKMQDNLTHYWVARDPNLPYNDSYSALIVASLIEKETARPEERAKIAGVIIRRLQQHMRLQIDASVIYGLADQYKGKLTHSDLKVDTPYNTYLHDGLPPTPIAMPSLPSIIAAMHPASGDELYYVAKGDGSHEFTATLEDHIAAIKKYHVQTLPLQDDDSSASLHPLMPQSHWEEKISNENLFDLQKVLTKPPVIKHNPSAPKTLPLAKKNQSKKVVVGSLKGHRSKNHDTAKTKGHLHHH